MLLDPEVTDHRARELAGALQQQDYAGAAQIADQLSYTRTARILTEQPMAVLAPFLDAFGSEHAGAILGELPPGYAADFLLTLPAEEAASLLGRMHADRALGLIGVLPEASAATLQGHLNATQRARIDALQSWPRDSVGSVMTPNYLSVRQDTTVRKTIDAIVSAPASLSRSSYVYVVDAHGKPQGVVSLKDLYRLQPDSRVDDAMVNDVVVIRADEEAARAARTLRNRRLTMLPVVDDHGVLLGVLTFSDAMDLIAEDIADRFSGVGPGTREESFYTPPLSAVRLRLPWMMLNIFLNLGAVWIIAGFEATIAQVAILAAFLPMITDMGGNVGIQSLSVAIRNIALDDARLRDLRRAVRKEIIIGVINGLALGAVFAVIAWALEGNPWIGALAGIALGINVILAGVVGGCLPFILKRMGRDPAMMTGPILTTITDITGVTIFLGLSTIFLAQMIGG